MLLAAALIVEIALGVVARSTGNEWEYAPLCPAGMELSTKAQCVTEKNGTVHIGLSLEPCFATAGVQHCPSLPMDIRFEAGTSRHFEDVSSDYNRILRFLEGGSRDTSVLPDDSGPVVGRFYGGYLVGLKFPRGASFATDDYPGADLNGAAIDLFFWLFSSGRG